MLDDSAASDPSKADSSLIPDAALPIARMSVGELFGHAETYGGVGDWARCVVLYGAWIEGNPDHPLLHAVYFNYAVALKAFGQSALAANALACCLKSSPEFSPAYINLGRLLEDDGYVGEAVGQWLTLVDQLERVNGNTVKYKLLALHQLARVLEAHTKDSAAEDALRQSLEISTSQPEAIQHLIALRQRQCRWPVVQPWGDVKYETLIAGISPLSLANLLDDPVFQLARAYRYNKDTIAPASPCSAPHAWSVARGRRHERLRIGYVSSDLREHAVGFAMTDVFEQHDKSRFEVFAYYCGIKRSDPTQLRIRAATEAWLDINGMSDEAVAARIVDDGIDILVDLNGYTKDARTRVFAFRPAPVAVNWFGFPGTMGSPYHHYLIADDVIVAPEDEIFYSEKVVRLPCYQPNDRKRVVAEPASRASDGLPESGIVYCCLNGTQKFTPELFHAWMAILARVEGSVLWLLSGTSDTDAELRKAAAKAGIAAERLVFAPKMPNPCHVARYANADLFLDTFPYGAHTTAADALWMAVPVLTISGRGFASRVCSSVLKAANLAELTVPDIQTYIETAVQLGSDGNRLSKLKTRLVEGRNTCLLFDTPRLVRELERLYQTMWSEFEAGNRPIPDLTNLDTYHEIGVELAKRGAANARRGSLEADYGEELALRNWQRPIATDERLWSESNKSFNRLLTGTLPAVPA